MAGKSYLRIPKGVFSNMNILAIALTTSAFSLMEHGWRPFWKLYLKTELNASIPVLGLLAMTQSSERLLFQLPGAFVILRLDAAPLQGEPREPVANVSHLSSGNRVCGVR